MDETIYVSNCPCCNAFPVQFIATEDPASPTRYRFLKRQGSFSHRELSTVLAALRYWQLRLTGSAPGDDFNDIASNGGEQIPLTADEIDELCERINQ